MNILLVDDEPKILEVLSMMLDVLGHQTCLAEDGQLALDKFQQQPEAFDLVLSDIKMPHMDGMELAAEIQQLKPELPVVLMTGHADINSPEDVLPVKVLGVLKKPFSLNELVDLLESPAEE